MNRYGEGWARRHVLPAQQHHPENPVKCKYCGLRFFGVH